MRARRANKGMRVVLAHEDTLPYIALSKQLVEMYRKELVKCNEDGFCTFVCKSAYVKGLEKPLYSFSEFFFPEKEDLLDYEKEYVALAYTGDIEECAKERDLYLNGQSANIPVLNANNIQDPDFKEGLTKLSLIDIVYLQNFRLFMKIDNDGLDMGVLSPHVDFSIQEISINIRYPSIPLCRRLLNKDEESLGSKTFGYLTLTSTGTVLPLMHDSYKEVTKYAMVGLWTFGEDITEQSLGNCKSAQSRVWGLLAHFFKHSAISYRFTFVKEKAAFLLISFNKNTQPKVFLFKMLEKPDAYNEISLSNYNVDFKDFEGVSFKNQKTKIRSFNIDLSNVPREPSLHMSVEILPKSNNFFKPSPKLNSRQDRPTSITGFQAEMRESVDSDLSLIKCIKNYQDKNEGFYRKTIERMQDQIGLLSQAIVSINQNLALLNQKIMNGQNERATDTFILPDLTTHSLSISESSNNLVFADDLKVSKTLSEVQVAQTNNRHKRYKTDDIEVIKERDPNSFKEPNSFDNLVTQDQQQKRPERRNRVPEEPDFKIPAYDKDESVEPEDEDMQMQVIASLNLMNDAIEYNPKNENTTSIPLPKINPKFKRYMPSSDSDMSDKESAHLYKTAKQRYHK